MAGKLSGSAIQSGTITVTQLSVGLNDTTNAAYAQANSAYGQANAARSDANTTFATVNTTFGTINTNYQAAYAQANTSLSASGGTLAGDLIITGNLTVSGNSTTLNTEILTVEDADIVLLSNVASTPALNAGIIVNRGTSTNTFLRWDEVTDKWGWSDDGSTTYKFNSALDAYAQANGAYGAANNRVLKAGDTMTGQLNISSGGLLVTGNVGIGTVNPEYKLDVVGSARVAETAAQNGYEVAPGSTNILTSYNRTTSTWLPLRQRANQHEFYCDGTERLRLDSSGNLGIGTTSPGNRLSVVSAAAGDAITFSNAAASNKTGFLYSDNQYVGLMTIGGAGNNQGVLFDLNNNRTLIQRIGGTTATFDSSGNVGIGTTSPATKLSVNGGIQILAGNALYFQNAAADGNGTISGAGGSGSNALSFNSGAAYLDASGNLGIGTSSPSSFGKVAISIAGTTTPTTLANIGPSSINLYTATNGSATSCTTGIFGWHASTGIASGIGFSRESSVDWGTQIRFYTHPTATSNIGDITERARFDSGGNFYIGTTTANSGVTILPSFSSANSSGVDIKHTSTSPSGDYYVTFQYNNGVIGFISQNGTTGVLYNTSSDYRLKTVLGAVANAGQRIDALQPIEYTWNANGERARGFLAHQFQEVYASSVSGTKDAVDANGNPAYQSMQASTSEVIADLVAEIQSLRARVAQLESK